MARSEPSDVRSHCGQFDVGPLQDALHQVDFATAFLRHFGPAAGQLPQLALPLGKDAARLQQAIAHQFGWLAGISLVRCALGHLLHVGGTDQERGQDAFQEGIHSPPELTRTFHGDMRGTYRRQPRRAMRSSVCQIP
jgi:hypothetical protein